MMRFVFAGMLVWLAAACASGSAAGRPSSMARSGQPGASQVERHATYAYAGTRTTDTAFQYLFAANDGRVEWRTLTLSVKPGAFEEGGELILLVEMSVDNRGSKDFRWDDYTFYLALPDATGDWDYRLLFSSETPDYIKAGERKRLRYRARFPRGATAPRRINLVFQNLLGGKDLAIPFASH